MTTAPETLEPNAFIGFTRQPSDADLTTALGPARDLWDHLLAELAAKCKLTDAEWHSYSPKAGWFIRLKVKKRNILYMSPCQGLFRVSFILGAKAIDATRNAAFPKAFQKLIEEGQQYPEGRGVRIRVKSAKDIAQIPKLAAIKMQN